jgi:hypothetical protein
VLQVPLSALQQQSQQQVTLLSKRLQLVAPVHQGQQQAAPPPPLHLQQEAPHLQDLNHPTQAAAALHQQQELLQQ